MCQWFKYHWVQRTDVTWTDCNFPALRSFKNWTDWVDWTWFKQTEMKKVWIHPNSLKNRNAILKRSEKSVYMSCKETNWYLLLIVACIRVSQWSYLFHVCVRALQTQATLAAALSWYLAFTSRRCTYDSTESDKRLAELWLIGARDIRTTA